MRALAVSEILELPVAERIRLVEIIWDSIAAVPEAVPYLTS
jgi:putative addiction module component (TIGR02574 family)